MFPQFNIHSSPLLILVVQGLIFAFLLLYRFFKEKRPSDALIGFMLLIMAYQRMAYTIGFMGWYDTFQHTKINYFLFSLDLGMGPIIYLYVRSILKTKESFKVKDWLHFLPVGLFFAYRIVLLIHDASQPDWTVGYEGEWLREIHGPYVVPFLRLLQYTSMLLYLAFSIQLFILYRQKIRQFFSNTYKLELNWLNIFLAVYCFLFVYESITDVIDAFIVELHYVNKWWVHFFYAIAIVFVGMKAWFTDLGRMRELTFQLEPEKSHGPKIVHQNYDRQKAIILQIMEDEKPWFQPDYSLKDLSKESGLGTNEASETINAGFGCNFNEFINRYRVEEVKRRLLDPAYSHLSILAIAFDSGFNSKATFNRIFKQFTGESPSQFKKNHAA